MLRSLGLLLLGAALCSCTEQPDPVDQTLFELKARANSDGFVVFSHPEENRFVQFSCRTDGAIEFQFPIRTVYLEGGLKPLLFDVIAEAMPTEGIIDTMETLTPEELTRLKEVLERQSIDYIESFRGGRDPADGPTRAYMHQIKGIFDPESMSGRAFVDAVFRSVYLYDEVPSYEITIN